MSARRRPTRVCAALVMMLFAGVSHAYSFTLNGREWAVWPDWCQGKYFATNVGARSIQAAAFPPAVQNAMMAQARSRLGDVAYTHVHHYCAGRIWLLRAQRLRHVGGREFEFAVEAGKGECSYTLLRVPVEHWLHVEMTMTLGLLLRLEGNYAEALSLVERALGAHPKAAQLYTLRYLVLRDQGDDAAALAALERGSDIADGSYAEIEYFLGLEHFKRGDHEKALVYAKRAYKLKYPLPALREKLQAAGVWK